ncbi:hypothetical protein ABU614_08985 [Lysobacter firmicutimachus]|uniref:Transmembrane protein n=1 Tax=Lysobacter firmicutimachus TaxID=1792846 RepID=A0AAU8MX93_9GAMM
MKNPDEKTLILQVLALLDGTAKRPGRIASAAATLAIWLLSFATALLYFQFGRPLHWTHGLVAVVCLGAGYWFAYDLYRSMSQRQWPRLTPYVDRAKLEKRLRELDGPPPQDAPRA